MIAVGAVIKGATLARKIWDWIKEEPERALIFIPLPLILLFIIGAVIALVFLAAVTSAGMEGVGGLALPTNVTAGTIPSQFVPLFSAAAQKYQVPLQFLAAEADQESTFNPNAKNFNDKIPTHAAGMFQFEPETWSGSRDPYSDPNTFDTDPQRIAQYGGYGEDANGDGTADPFDPADAAMAAAHYLRTLYDTNKHSWQLASYSYGEPTQAYVQSVLQYTESFFKENPTRKIGSYYWFVADKDSKPVNQSGNSVTVSANPWDPIIAPTNGSLNVQYSQKGDTLIFNDGTVPITYRGNIIAFVTNGEEVSAGDVMAVVENGNISVSSGSNPMSLFPGLSANNGAQ